VKHRLERIKSIKEMLAQLPTVEIETAELTTLEAVKMLRSEVSALQRKGYTFEMIAKVLEEHGFSVTASTLKKYRSAKKPDSQRKGAKKDPLVPTQALPVAQQSLFSGAEDVMQPSPRPEPVSPRSGGFTPVEDTRDI
jgi:hypothetical protein